MGIQMFVEHKHKHANTFTCVKYFAHTHAHTHTHNIHWTGVSPVSDGITHWSLSCSIKVTEEPQQGEEEEEEEEEDQREYRENPGRRKRWGREGEYV